MIAMLRRLFAALIADDPRPEPSWLDRLDRPTSPRHPLCSVLGCDETPTKSIKEFPVCDTHTPVMV